MAMLPTAYAEVCSGLWFFSRTRVHVFQVLAINRAEGRKFIRVKLDFPARLISRIRGVISESFLHGVHPTHHNLFWAAFDDGWKRLMKPYLTRKLRCARGHVEHHLQGTRPLSRRLLR
uniref:LAGLIDADG_2 domain-containing protein n=1 Tax=Mesocestoides corti TaxID=53468 RepID=A0A5K3FEM0_MESCO